MGPSITDKEPIVKKVLLVLAHPEPQSLNAYLLHAARAELQAQGHEVMVSDLYAMGWKAVVDSEDFPDRLDPARLDVVVESGHGWRSGSLTPDVRAEQAKLRDADAVVFQFPLWWFGMPAIMKGWIERVFAYGLAYGYRNEGNHYRYGEGGLHGKRALLSVTTGGPALDYAPRGINGQLDELLFPITHGTLFFPGMEVLPTYAIHDAHRLGSEGVERAVAGLRARIRKLFDDAPLPYRPQNGGDYPDRHVLADTIAPGMAGVRVHLRSTQDVE
jgi:NAD(P)H dehydrogenase (quinone)